MVYAHLMADKFKTNWLAVLGLALWSAFLVTILTFVDPDYALSPTSMGVGSFSVPTGRVAVFCGLFTVGWLISRLIRSLKKQDTPAQHYRRWAAIQAINAFLIWVSLTQETS